MSKFKVGDIIIPLPSAEAVYMTMNQSYNAVLKVLEVDERRGLLVEILKSDKHSKIGKTHRVKAKYFELDITDPFEALLRGQINEKEYEERIKK